MSRLTASMRPGFSSWLMACWKRRLNSSAFRSASLLVSSAGCISRSSLAFIGAILLHGVLADNKFALDGQLVHGQAQGLAGSRLIHVRQLEQHAAGLDDSHPVLGRAFTGAHAGLGGLFGDRLVGEDLDPDLAATLDITGHGDTGGLDLGRGDPGRLQGNKAVLALAHHGAAGGLAGHAAALAAAVLTTLRQ